MIQEQIIIKINEVQNMLAKKAVMDALFEGGASSGHWGHKGVKGQRGGSAAGGFTAMPGERIDLQPEIKKRGLTIPPVWKNVRLNIDPAAPLQVLGIDTKGRQQPIYSVKHSKESAAEKFSRIKEFTKKVPEMQKRIEKDFNTSDEAKVLYLISKTGFRVGSDTNTKAEVKAYGASTLEARHVTVISESTVKFKFVGKKGVVNSATVTDKRLAKYLSEKKTGKVFNTTDSKIRSYLKKIDGEFKVKDFRTFIGTSEALKMIGERTPPKTAKERDQIILDVCRNVAKKLGNTISVAKSAYIAPEVWSKLS